jgi:hypothetical protein
MRLALAALLAFGPALAQDKKDAKDGDKIGGDKAPVVAKKALAEVQKKKGAAIAESNQYAAIQQMVNTLFEGVLKGDFAAVKGTAELYAKGSQYLMNAGGRFDPPDGVLTQEGIQAQAFRNPAVILKELEQITPSATFGGDETVDAKACRVVDLVASPALVKHHLKDLGDRLQRAVKAAAGTNAGQFLNFQNQLEERGTVATYRVCIGKDDLLVYKIEFVIKPKLKSAGLPKELQGMNLDARTEVKFSKWDEEGPFDVPGPVKAKFGLK